MPSQGVVSSRHVGHRPRRATRASIAGHWTNQTMYGTPAFPPPITLLARLLALIGGFPTRLTPRDALGDLIGRLHPLACGRELRRLGPARDGGYLVPDDLPGIATCLSAGIGCDSGFEFDCAELGMDVFLADGSVPGPAVTHPRFHFTRRHLGSNTSRDRVSPDAWAASIPGDSAGDLLLKLDIEGAEYEVLHSASDALLARCRIVVIEFHHLGQLWSAPFFRLAAPAFDKLLRTHACVHIHPNNGGGGALRLRGLDLPPVMEFTFLRHDRMPPSPRHRTDFPHPLDRDNTSRATLPLPATWRRPRNGDVGHSG